MNLTLLEKSTSLRTPRKILKSKIPDCKAKVIGNFITNKLEFDATYEAPLKVLYTVYKKNCTHSLLLGKLLFKNWFLILAECEGYEVVARSTSTGVVFEGTALRPNN